MALNFPNQTRSYEPLKHSIRFWGHDGAFEICFFVEGKALMRISPNGSQDEAGYLSVFDLFRERILEAAKRVYSGRRRDAYVLHASDF